MTVKECYEQMDSNYNNVLERLGSESLVKRFALKFKDDPSFCAARTLCRDTRNYTRNFALQHLKRSTLLHISGRATTRSS